MSQEADLPPRPKHDYIVFVTDAPALPTSGVDPNAPTPVYREIRSEEHQESPERAMEVAIEVATLEFRPGTALSATCTLGEKVCRRCDGRGHDRSADELLSGTDPWTGFPRCPDCNGTGVRSE